jgi:hypothetical protein
VHCSRSPLAASVSIAIDGAFSFHSSTTIRLNYRRNGKLVEAWAGGSTTYLAAEALHLCGVANRAAAPPPWPQAPVFAMQ